MKYTLKELILSKVHKAVSYANAEVDILDVEVIDETYKHVLVGFYTYFGNYVSNFISASAIQEIPFIEQNKHKKLYKLLL